MPFLEDVLEVAKNIKFAAGPKSQIQNMQGASYNSLMAPMIERKDDDALAQLLLDLNESQGTDMKPFRKYYEDGKATGRPMGKGALKILGELALKGYGGDRPMGKDWAAKMVPGTLEGAPLSPEQQGPQKYTVTPQQEAYRDILARGKPDAMLKEMPEFMGMAESLGTNQPGSAAKEQFFEGLWQAFPNLTPPYKQLLRNAPGFSIYSPEARDKLTKTAQQWSKELSEAARHEEQRTYTRGRDTASDTRRIADDATKAEAQTQQAIRHYARQLDKSHLLPPQKAEVIKRLETATTPAEATRIFGEEAAKFSPTKPRTIPDIQKVFMANSKSVTLLSRYMKGQGVDMAALAEETKNAPLPFSLLPGAPPPDPAMLNQHLRMMLDQQEELASEMTRLDPAQGLALKKQVAAMRQSIGVDPSTAPAAPAPQAAANPALKQDFDTALKTALAAQNYTTLPPVDSPTYQSVLNTVLASMLAKGYPATSIVPSMQRLYPTWRPVSPPSQTTTP